MSRSIDEERLDRVRQSSKEKRLTASGCWKRREGKADFLSELNQGLSKGCFVTNAQNVSILDDESSSQ